MTSQESQFQSLCVRYFKKEYPKILIYHVPNGGQRNAVEAMNFKRMGLMAGIPDLVIPTHSKAKRFNALFIELKVKKNKQADRQKHIEQWLVEMGNCVAVCYTFEQFQKTVYDYFTNR